MTLREYVDSLRNKTVAVLGVGVSNTPLVRLLLQNGVSVAVCDKRTRQQMGALADELERGGCTLRLGPDYLEGLHEDVIFRTPGLRPDMPQIAAAVSDGSVLTSEMEAFFQVCPCPIIAVTGSDGKTTTTTIIAELLKAAGKTVWLGGNIGHPLLCDADRMHLEDYAVLELSSFQLMTMEQSPHIAVMTTLSPNHLDYHHTFDDYFEAKALLFSKDYPARRVISIDGGCSLKDDGQLNALIIPYEGSEDFSFEAYDPFPVRRVKSAQRGGGKSYYIRWGDNDVQVLRRGEEFSLVRHVRTGYEMEILTKYLYSDEEFCKCNDSTDLVLSLEAGDEVSVVEETSRGYLVKHKGTSGWYWGELI